MKFKYFIKKLSPNDLGFRKGKPGNSQYVSISQKAFGDFFPKFEGRKEFSFQIPILDKTFILEVDATGKDTKLALNKTLVPPGTFIPEDIMLIENLGEERYKLIRIMKEDIKYENYLLLIQQKKNLIEAV
jgi:hypothetical protein